MTVTSSLLPWRKSPGHSIRERSPICPMKCVPCSDSRRSRSHTSSTAETSGIVMGLQPDVEKIVAATVGVIRYYAGDALRVDDLPAEPLALWPRPVDPRGCNCSGVPEMDRRGVLRLRFFRGLRRERVGLQP